MSEPHNLVDCYRCSARVPITATDIDENGYLCNQCVLGASADKHLADGALLTGRLTFDGDSRSIFDSDYDDEW